MTKFFFKSKLPIFNPFPNFFWQIFFFPKIKLSWKTSYGFLAPFQNSEKSNNQIPRKHPNKLQEERRDKPPFHRILLATTGGLTSTTQVDCHLKVKHLGYDVFLTKKLLHHRQHAKNQLNSYTHSADFRASRTGYTHFWPHPPRNQ